jgi:hypothetical protein
VPFFTSALDRTREILQTGKRPAEPISPPP